MISRKKISMDVFINVFIFSDLILTEWLVFNSMIFILFLVVMTRLSNCGTLLFVDIIFSWKWFHGKTLFFIYVYLLFFKSIMIKKWQHCFIHSEFRLFLNILNSITTQSTFLAFFRIVSGPICTADLGFWRQKNHFDDQMIKIFYAPTDRNKDLGQSKWKNKNMNDVLV